MNSGLFEEWLQFFANAVPSSTKRPILLVLDGCGSHYSSMVVAAAAHLSLMLVFLPPNATHLLQPLDVAVFATLKSKIHNMIDELVEEDDNGFFNISKDDAKKACGLFPLSLVKMGARLRTFTRNGVPRHVQLATWLQTKAVVEDEILKLLSAPRKHVDKKCKRITVGGRLLTHEGLQEMEAERTRRGASKRKKTKPSVSTASDIVESALV